MEMRDGRIPRESYKWEPCGKRESDGSISRSQPFFPLPFFCLRFLSPYFSPTIGREKETVEILAPWDRAVINSTLRFLVLPP